MCIKHEIKICESPIQNRYLLAISIKIKTYNYRIIQFQGRQQRIKIMPYTKLMRLDRPLAKFCLKSDSNRVSINFFNPIPAARFTCRNDSIRIRKRIRSKSLISIKNG